ncbi:MAG: dockerin type I domain-containing protein [Phycisphaerae bacterium]
MKAPRAIAITLALVLANFAIAQDTFTVNITRDGSGPLGLNETFPFVIEGQLTVTDGSNLGLAFFAFDLEVVPNDGGDPINLSLAVNMLGAPGVSEFEKPAGYSVDFTGTPVGNDLIQLGGGTNTINNTDPPDFPVGVNVPQNVGHGGIEMYVANEPGFGFTIPGDVGSGGPFNYTFRIKEGSLHANVITSFDGSDYVVDPVNAVIGADVQFEVVLCVPVPAAFAEPQAGISFANRAWDGFVDARRESNDGNTVNQGLDTITIEFTTEMENADGAPISAAAFSISDTAGTPPTIDNVTSSDGGKTVTLELSGHITLQQWTTFSFDGRDACSQAGFSGSIDIGFLPCDVNQDGRCNPLDVTKFRQYVNDIIEPDIGIEDDYTDINRNGSTNPLDLTGLRQLVFGTGLATKVWAGEVLPAQP